MSINLLVADLPIPLMLRNVVTHLACVSLKCSLSLYTQNTASQYLCLTFSISQGCKLPGIAT